MKALERKARVPRAKVSGEYLTHNALKRTPLLEWIGSTARGYEASKEVLREINA